MTNTEVSWRVTGVAWPQHFNKIVAENDVREHQDGRPARTGTTTTSRWPRRIQKEAEAAAARARRARSAGCRGRYDRRTTIGGGSDDIGDVSWNVPTVTLNYPSNIPGMPGHNWANAVAMATPIAHKGATAGAKVIAMTTLDLLLRPELVQQAWDYFRTCRRKIRNTSRSSVRPISRSSRSTPRRWSSIGRSCGSTTSTRRSTRRISSSSASNIRRSNRQEGRKTEGRKVAREIGSSVVGHLRVVV